MKEQIETMQQTFLQTLFSFQTLEQRWEISVDTLHRRAKDGSIKTIVLSGRRLVPLSEVQRIEREGLQGAREDAARRSSQHVNHNATLTP